MCEQILAKNGELRLAEYFAILCHLFSIKVADVIRRQNAYARRTLRPLSRLAETLKKEMNALGRLSLSFTQIHTHEVAWTHTHKQRRREYLQNFHVFFFPYILTFAIPMSFDFPYVVTQTRLTTKIPTRRPLAGFFIISNILKEETFPISTVGKFKLRRKSLTIKLIRS